MAKPFKQRRAEISEQRRVQARREQGGRRKTDKLPRTTLTKKFVVAVVAAINFAYLILQVLADSCNGFRFPE